jgi:hypothetical protein
MILFNCLPIKEPLLKINVVIKTVVCKVKLFVKAKHFYPTIKFPGKTRAYPFIKTLIATNLLANVNARHCRRLPSFYYMGKLLNTPWACTMNFLWQ